MTQDRHKRVGVALVGTGMTAAQIVQTCERHRAPLGVVFQHRFCDASQRLQRTLRDGAFGELGAR